MPIQDSITDNRRIAKNTLLLYLRAIVIMFIGLFTSRVLLQKLGVTDVGVYNVVGGIVSLFGFITSSLSNSISRYISYSIGIGNQDLLNKTFSNIKFIYLSLIVIFIIFGETIGLWYLYNFINVPQNRFDAALWVYHLSIFSTVLALLCVPYNASIVAHERMSTFAYISFLDAIYKLVIIYLLKVIPFDSLKVYATLVFILGIVKRIIYTVYCRKHFEEARVAPKFQKTQIKELLTFSTWVIGGNLAWIANTHGVNLLLNLFFGPIVNAARAIALQVQGVVSQFVTNFQTAVNPQITKTYAQKDFNRMHNLIVWSSKFSYYLLLVFCLPLIFERDFVLNLWLETVPDNTSGFLFIVLISALLKPFSNPIWTAVLATGNLKKYQIYDNVLQFLVLPSSYILLKFFNFPPFIVYVVIVFYDIILIPTRLWIVLPLIHFKSKEYCQRVLLPIFSVTVISVSVSCMLFSLIDQTIIGRIAIIISVVLVVLMAVLFFGLQKYEKQFLVLKIKNIRNR